MNKKTYILINILLFTITLGFLVHTPVFADTPRLHIIIEGAGILLVCLWRISKAKDSPQALQKKALYEQTYAYILKDAFSSDKSSYQKLLKVADCYNYGKYKKAYRLLNKLEKKCVSFNDYSAVYTFYALCHEEEYKYEDAIKYYEKISYYGTANSTIWSNLGLCYDKTGQITKSYDAYSNAIMLDPQNEYAYNNMAFCLIDLNEPEQALTYALKAIELKSNFHIPMQAAAISYYMLGDYENYKKYCQMYGMNGGNIPKLKEYLNTLSVNNNPA